MLIYLDTNILVYYLQKNGLYTDEINRIFDLIVTGKVTAFMSSQSIVDCFYILRKTIAVEDLRQLFCDLAEIVEIVGANKKVTLNALKNLDFKDFEDCVQAECAFNCGAEYIITANIKDFEFSQVKAITPTMYNEQCIMYNVK